MLAHPRRRWQITCKVHGSIRYPSSLSEAMQVSGEHLRSFRIVDIGSDKFSRSLVPCSPKGEVYFNGLAPRPQVRMDPEAHADAAGVGEDSLM